MFAMEVSRQQQQQQQQWHLRRQQQQPSDIDPVTLISNRNRQKVTGGNVYAMLTQALIIKKKICMKKMYNGHNNGEASETLLYCCRQRCAVQTTRSINNSNAAQMASMHATIYD